GGGGHRAGRADQRPLRPRGSGGEDFKERLPADPCLPCDPARHLREDRPGVSRRTRVGICAWADPALIETGTFYPRKSMSAEARLRHYASVFDVVEVNSSYYAIPDIRNSQRWVERTPAGFIFHVKAYSLMTGHHPRAETVPADLVPLPPKSPQRTRRGAIDATSLSPEAVRRLLPPFRAPRAPLAPAP